MNINLNLWFSTAKSKYSVQPFRWVRSLDWLIFSVDSLNCYKNITKKSCFFIWPFLYILFRINKGKQRQTFSINVDLMWNSDLLGIFSFVKLLKQVNISWKCVPFRYLFTNKVCASRGNFTRWNFVYFLSKQVVCNNYQEVRQKILFGITSRLLLRYFPFKEL